MAINDTDIGDEAPKLVEQISRLLPALYGRPKHQPKAANLLESFDVWKLDTEYLKDASASGRFPASRTGYQHHQIQVNNRVQAYALSRQSDSGSRRIVKVALSKNAERIDKAIDRIDEKVNDDTIVRLLTVRPYSVYAFWLVDRHEVYVFSAPSYFKRLRPRQFLTEADFMNVFQDEIENLKLRRNYNLRKEKA